MTNHRGYLTPAEINHRGNHRGYHRGSLESAFNTVQPKTHWKDPIDAIVPSESLAITVEAIMFYTATPCTVTPCEAGKDMEPEQRYFRVQSIGYRAGPAGDH
jgi:hypothetical protein